MSIISGVKRQEKSGLQSCAASSGSSHPWSRCLVLLSSVLSCAALSALDNTVSNAFWDTTGYVNAVPVVQTCSAEQEISSVDSVPAYTRVLAMFDSHDQRGLTFIVR